MKLYGFTMSNYFNMVKMAMLEKGVEFEFVNTMPSQEADYLAKSSMGKVPCLETDRGFLSETSVILDYLEDTQGGIALYPSDPWERAKVKELMKSIELYIELPARRCFAETFFGGKVSEETKKQVEADLKKGIKALGKLAVFGPYVAGDKLTYADLIFMFSVGLASQVAKKLFDMDLLADLPKAKECLAMLNERDAAKTVNADMRAGMKKG
jgi:glutathione S-transferase